MATIGLGYLVERIRTGTAWNEPVPETFYGDGPVGYLDYPVMGE
jgi:N-ethylmaleimide reductase